MEKPEQFMKVQNQIRENSMQIRDYLDDLNKWQDEIKQKDTKITKTVPASYATAPDKSASTQSSKKDYKRDGNTIRDYYRAWDSFNVDKELEELDNQTTYTSTPMPKIETTKTQNEVKGAKANSKVTIKGGRNAIPASEDFNQLKTVGNSHFSKKEFDKAIDCYTKALKLEEVPKEIKLALHSNRAQAYINVKRYKEAETDCLIALELDANHTKSLHRCGVARYYLKDFREAKKCLEKALALAPEQKDIQGEIERIRKEMEKVRIEQLQMMVERGKVGKKDRIAVKVEDIKEDEGLKALEEKRKELERELQSKPKKGLEDFLSDDEDNDLNQLS